MIKLKSFKQTKGYCGPAVLKTLFEYYGVKKSERELARISGATREKGVGAKGLLKAAAACGFKGFVKDFSEISDLRRYAARKKIPVIVAWFLGDEGHYSLVVDVKKDRISLYDPEIGKIRTLNLDNFKRLWFDFPSPYIERKRDIKIRRMIVIFPKD